MKAAILSFIRFRSRNHPDGWINGVDVRVFVAECGFWFGFFRAGFHLRSLADAGMLERREVDDKRPERGGRPTVQYRLAR